MKSCLNDCEEQMFICFDSVISDSRCPKGVWCFWQGEAEVRFEFKNYKNDSFFVDLKNGTKDTIINNYKFSYLDLLPYPVFNEIVNPVDYKAKVVVKKK